ncbi:MAG: hypothetical protein ABSE87_11555 [Terracidiphilus sp.]|jgi:hypothetical protein
MTHFNANVWEIAAGAILIAALVAITLWLVLRKRATPEELERARRKFLAQYGRLVDGMLLDIREIPGEDGRTLTMLLYAYRFGGVDYEASQDVTTMSDVLDFTRVCPGFPCSARYQPGNPQNSIVVAEEWTGLRMCPPVYPAYDDPEPLDLSHLRPGRG